LGKRESKIVQKKKEKFKTQLEKDQKKKRRFYHLQKSIKKRNKDWLGEIREARNLKRK